MKTKELFQHWNEVRQGLYQALDKLTDEQLSFTPREGLWSLGQVTCHIAGTEDSWFRFYVSKELKGWEEADYQLKDFPTVTDLKALLKKVHYHTEKSYASQEEEALERMVKFPWGAEASINYVIWHVLEHEIHHRGEIYLMLGLLGMEAPDV